MDAVSLKLARNYTNEKLNSLPSNAPTKTVTFDGGIYSVGNDVVNGQVSAILKGNTWTNRAGIGDTSPQTIENLDSAKTYLLIKTDGGTVNVDAVDTAVPAKITGKTSTVLTWSSGKIALYELSAEEAALDVAVLGQKYHYVSGTKSTNSVRVKSVGKNLFDVKSCEGKTGWRVDPVRVIGTGIEVSGYIPSGVGYANIPYKLKPNTQYTMSFNAINNQGVTPALNIRNSNNEAISSINGSGKKQKTFMTDSVGRGWFFFYSAGLPVSDAGVYTTIYSDIQLESGTVATPYEPYKESIAYINGAGELRSLPNGTKDEVNVTTGVKTQRISGDLILNGSLAWQLTSTDETGTVIMLNQPSYFPNALFGSAASLYGTNADMVFGSHIPSGTNGRIVFGGESKRELYVRIPLDNATLQQSKDYLTAKPITLNYQLATPIVTKLPAQAPLQVFENGTVYVEPLGDPSETTLPTVELTAPIAGGNKVGIATHDYAGAAADWVLTNNESKCKSLLVTNAGGAANIIAPDKPGLTFTINNKSGQAITIKKSGGTGVTVTAGKKVTVQHFGTDYEAISPEI